MHFYPSPDDGSCEITSITMEPYKVSVNAYGYKDIQPKYRSEIKLRRYHGAFEFLQRAYLPNTQWWAHYHYRKKVVAVGPFGEEQTKWLYGSGVVKNIPEGKATIYLPCKGSGFLGRVKEKARDMWQNKKHYIDSAKKRVTQLREGLR